MKVSGFTFVRNAIRYDYPVVEAIQSILPLCTELVVAVGNSDDDTLQLIRSSPRQVLNNVVGKCDKLHRRLINVEFLMVKTLHGFSFRAGARAREDSAHVSC